MIQWEGITVGIMLLGAGYVIQWLWSERKKHLAEIERLKRNKRIAEYIGGRHIEGVD